MRDSSSLRFCGESWVLDALQLRGEHDTDRCSSSAAMFKAAMTTRRLSRVRSVHSPHSGAERRATQSRGSAPAAALPPAVPSHRLHLMSSSRPCKDAELRKARAVLRLPSHRLCLCLSPCPLTQRSGAPSSWLPQLGAGLSSMGSLAGSAAASARSCSSPVPSSTPVPCHACLSSSRSCRSASSAPQFYSPRPSRQLWLPLWPFRVPLGIQGRVFPPQTL